MQPSSIEALTGGDRSRTVRTRRPDLSRSTTAATVVDFPAPVGPQNSTNPYLLAIALTRENATPGAISRSDIVINGLSLPDRKSTRLNSCHTVISYAVFCLKKK